MAVSQVTFYDVAASHGKCNSPNTWKTRLLLNYKQIPYETKWLEYPDVEPTLKSLGLAPHPDSPFRYKDFTLPAISIHYDDGKVEHMMDSRPVALRLEELFPTPDLEVRDPLITEVEDAMMKLQMATYVAFMLELPRVFNPPSAKYYLEERAKLFGVPLQTVYDAKAPTVMEDSKAELQAFRDLYKRDESGPFIKGKQMTYADFVFVAWLAMLDRLGGGNFERFAGVDESFKKVYDACQPWLERDDH